MSEVVRNYYNNDVDWEWQRLETPYRRFEMQSTLRLVDEHFPPEGRIADIGGGPGRYTIELLRRGYRVTLVDLADRNVEFARAKLAELGLKADAVVRSDACDLSSLATESFDLLIPGAFVSRPRMSAFLEFALDDLRREAKRDVPGYSFQQLGRMQPLSPGTPPRDHSPRLARGRARGRPAPTD